MSTTPIPTPERDAQMLAIGQQCSLPSCHTVDFLPFKCAHCTQPFCSEHYIPKTHSCAKYDEHAHDRVAPDCPMCNKPVAIPPGTDPNARMEAHFARECSVMTGRTAKKSPTCGNKKCGKVLIAPIQCNTCKQQFCPQHRFPNTHTCTTSSAASTPGRSGSSTPAQSSSAAVAAAVAAAKRQATTKATKLAAKAQSQLNSVGSSGPAASSSTSKASAGTAPSKPKAPLPFSATDRSPSSVSSASPSTTSTVNTKPSPSSSPIIPTSCAASVTRSWLFDTRATPSIFG